MFPRGQQWNNRTRDQARKPGFGANRGQPARQIPEGGSKLSFFLDIDAARAQLGPTRLIEVYTSFKQAVTNYLLDQPKVRETIQNGGPVNIASRDVEKFKVERRIFNELVSSELTSLPEEDGQEDRKAAPYEQEDDEDSSAIKIEDPKPATKAKARGKAPKLARDLAEEETQATMFSKLNLENERVKEERKIAHEQAKDVVKALVEYQKNCQETVKTLFNTSVMSKSIISGLDSVMGEHEEAKHYIPGYGPLPSREDIVNTRDDGRRRYDVARERGYICILFKGLEALFAPKVRRNEKTLLLKEFYLFAPKPHEPANQVIKRFYDRVHDIRVAGINIPNDQQMVILLEALSNDPMITERIIQLKEEIERGEGVKTISELEERINHYLRI
jgi:hypothetical protein